MTEDTITAVDTTTTDTSATPSAVDQVAPIVETTSVDTTPPVEVAAVITDTATISTVVEPAVATVVEDAPAATVTEPTAVAPVEVAPVVVEEPILVPPPEPQAPVDMSIKYMPVVMENGELQGFLKIGDLAGFVDSTRAYFVSGKLGSTKSRFALAVKLDTGLVSEVSHIDYQGSRVPAIKLIDLESAKNVAQSIAFLTLSGNGYHAFADMVKDEDFGG